LSNQALNDEITGYREQVAARRG